MTHLILGIIFFLFHKLIQIVISEVVKSVGLNSQINNPSRLSHALKQSLRNIAIGVVKFVQLFALYARSESRLTRTEQHEIMLYAKKCLPIFLGQVTACLLQFQDKEIIIHLFICR